MSASCAESCGHWDVENRAEAGLGSLGRGDVPEHNKKVAACDHVVRSGEPGTEAARATAETLDAMSGLEDRSARSDVLAKPGSEIRLIEFPASEREEKSDNLFLWCFNAEAVQPKE